MKKYVSGFLAVLLAVAVSAFTVPEQKSAKGLTLKYFTYDNFPNNTWINDPSHYTMTTNSGQDPLDCPGSEARCGVRAEENGITGKPVLSGAEIFEKDL